MVKVLIPGKPWQDAQKPKPIGRRVAFHLLKDLAAQPRTSVSLLLLSLVAITFFYLGLPHVFVDGRFYVSGGQDVFVDCDYVGFESFTKPGPDCPWIAWRKP